MCFIGCAWLIDVEVLLPPHCLILSPSTLTLDALKRKRIKAGAVSQGDLRPYAPTHVFQGTLRKGGNQSVRDPLDAGSYVTILPVAIVEAPTFRRAQSGTGKLTCPSGLGSLTNSMH